MVEKDVIQLRDYLAAKAMQAMLTNDALLRTISSKSKKEGVNKVVDIASMSYEMADAMLKQREQH